MTSEDYRHALAAAIKEYEDLGQQRRDIDDRLAQLGQTIGTLTRLLGLTPTVPLGLTDACRLVLRGAGLPMTSMDVRQRLLSIGIDLSGYASELSAIHTTLKRLNEGGEIRLIARGTDKQAYLWQRPASAAGLGPEVAQFARGMDNSSSGANRKPAAPKPPARRRSTK